MSTLKIRAIFFSARPAVPGIGVHFVDAVLSKDLTLIMGVTLVYFAMLITFNLAVDVMYAWVDPRIDTAG